MAIRIFIITFALLIASCITAPCDVIHFKDGGKIEGLIKEEASDHVVIDIGIGTMTALKEDIERIEKATTEELEKLKQKNVRHQIESGEWSPLGFEDIKLLYNRAKTDKQALLETKRKGAAVGNEIARTEKRVSELLEMLDKKGKTLKTMSAKKNVAKYNAIVSEMNTINVYLNDASSKIKSLYTEEKDMNTHLANLISAYRDNFLQFKDAYRTRRAELDYEMLNDDEVYYLEVMDDVSFSMSDDFKRMVARYTPEGSHVIVDAILEKSVTAQLMVDTGASVVVISENVAKRLGINRKDIKAQVEFVVADGRKVKATPIVLNSVKVGNAEVKNVQAAIMDSGDVGSSEGLLGMSFLRHFTISVDSTSNQLILERIL